MLTHKLILLGWHITALKSYKFAKTKFLPTQTSMLGMQGVETKLITI